MQHTQVFNGPLSGTTHVGQYQNKHSLTDSAQRNHEFQAKMN